LSSLHYCYLHSFPTRRSSDLYAGASALGVVECWVVLGRRVFEGLCDTLGGGGAGSDGRGYLRPLGNDLSDQTICGFGGATELLDGFKCAQRFGELSQIGRAHV